MGGGYYDSSARSLRATKSGLLSKSTQEIFSSRNINSAMNPYGVKIRESRDSEEHPNSFPIIIALDETGSMGTVPDYLVRYGLPNIMEGIINKGLKDPQVLFLGIGDHECDNAPLQVGQFESSDELLDKWLTSVYIEGKGGGNDGESYHLAWYFAGNHTSIDHFEKRGKKGVLFTIGDEPVLKNLPGNFVKQLMGLDQVDTNYSAYELYEKASEMYECFHLNVCSTRSGSRRSVQDDWKQMINDNLILVKDREAVCEVITNKIIDVAQSQSMLGVSGTFSEPNINVADENEVKSETPNPVTEEMML